MKAVLEEWRGRGYNAGYPCRRWLVVEMWVLKMMFRGKVSVGSMQGYRLVAMTAKKVERFEGLKVKR